MNSSANAGVEVESSTNSTKPESSTTHYPSEEYVPKWYSMFTNIPGDWVQYYQTTFKTENILPFIGISAATAALIVADDQTWRWSHGIYDRSHFIHQASDFMENLGDGRPQFGLAGAFAAYGFAFGDRRALRTSSQICEAILSCGAVIQVIKHITGRESPNVSTVTRGRWDFFPNQIEYHKHVPCYDAYPSGHIATALTTLLVIAENYPECKWLRPVGYPVVALIGFSMGNTGIHWYSDYPLGLSLGYTFAMIVTHSHSSSTTDTSAGISVAPVLSEGRYGMAIKFPL